MPNETLRLTIDSRGAVDGTQRLIRATERLGSAQQRQERVLARVGRALQSTGSRLQSLHRRMRSTVGISSRLSAAMSGLRSAASRGRDALRRLADQSRNTGISLRNLARRLGPLGSALTLGAAVVGVRRLVQIGTEAETAASKLNFVFRDSSESVRVFLREWATLAGLDFSSAEDQAATIGAIAQGPRHCAGRVRGPFHCRAEPGG